MIFGHWMKWHRSRMPKALKELGQTLPDEAELVTNDGTEVVAVSEPRVGDQVLVRPGSKVPADERNC